MTTKVPIKRVSQTAGARQLIEKLQAVREQIPGFALPTGSSPSRKLNATASIPAKFIEAASVAVDSSPQLKAASSMDTDAAREVIAFAAAYESVAEEAEALAKAIRHTISVQKAQVGNDALQAYDLAKGLARKNNGAALVPHINEMKRALARGPRRRGTTQAPASIPKQS